MTLAALTQPSDGIMEPGSAFAGTHLLIDIWQASNLTDPEFIQGAFMDAASAAGATVLHAHFHHFTPDFGVSGVLVLAESHMSIHTWPDRHFASIDIYMCGACSPYDALYVLKKAFGGEVTVSAHQRGSTPVPPSE